MVQISKTDADNSVSSSSDVETSFNEKRVLELAKQLLKGRIFIGTLHEKYRVEKLDAYRDIISIAENERQLIRALRDLAQHVNKFYPSESWWLGITEPGTVGLPYAHCLWVEIPDGNPLGRYWFKIRNVKFRNGEMVISVKIERKIDEETLQNSFTTTANNNVSGGNNVDDNNSPISVKDDLSYFTNIFKETLEKLIDSSGKSFRYFFKNVTTPQNIRETIVFLFLLLIACVTGLFELLKFLCDFLIKFMYAWSHFVKASLPILQVLLNFFENLFKVLCTLIAYLFKRQQNPVYYQTVTPPNYVGYHQRQSIDYRPRRQGVIITELN